MSSLVQSMDEGTTLTLSASDFLANATDVDTPTQDLQVENLYLDPAHGTITDNGDDTWTFVPAEDFHGSVQFSYSVSDGEAMTPASMSVMVHEVNDPPVAVDDVAPGSFEAGQSVVITAAQLLENDYDLDGYPGQLTVVSVEVVSGEGTLVPGTAGTWTFAPDAAVLCRCEHGAGE